MPRYVCKLCDPNVKREFSSREELKEHILTHHSVEGVLSMIRLDKLSNLENRGINPKNWAAGRLIAFGGGERID